jgi:hypothetical protein
MRFCAAGRVIDVMQASHPAAISTSGGRLAAFTRRFVLAIAHLSNEAMRVVALFQAVSNAIDAGLSAGLIFFTGG